MDEHKINANPGINAVLANMTEASLEHVIPLLHVTVTLSRPDRLPVPSYITDIKSHHELHLADVLCLTETHLRGSFVFERFQLEGYNTFKYNKMLCRQTALTWPTKIVAE